MSISLKMLNKIRGRLLCQTSGEPVAGVVVSLSIAIDEKSHIPVSTLKSDATGYFSFDLQPLIKAGLDTVSGLFISAPQVGLQNYNLLKTLLASTSEGQTPTIRYNVSGKIDSQDKKSLCIEFPIYVEDSKVYEVSDSGCQIANLASIQSPDVCDYEFSPYSFVTPTKINLGGDCCETLAPSTLPVQEHAFYRVIVRHDSSRDVQLQGGKLSRLVEVDRQLPEPQRVIKVAEVLEYRQRWYAIGHSLGEIKYSLPLAPGESTELAVIDWTRNDTAGRFDDVLATEFLQHELHRDRSIEDSIEAGLHESQSGWSWAGGLSSGMTYDTFLYGKYSGDWAAGGSTSNTRGDRNLDAESLNQLHDAVTQGTSYVRSLNSTVLVQANQAEGSVLQTRRVANHNHCHALTIEYYEVLRHFRLRTEFRQRRNAVLIPFSPMTFTRDLALRFRTLLERSLLDEKLLDCFDALIRLSLGPDAYDDKPEPAPQADDKKQDEDGQYFFGSRLSFPVIAATPGGITATGLSIKKGSTLTLTATSTGIKFGKELTAKTFGPEGSDAYGYPPEPTMHAGALLADIGGDRYEVGLGRTLTAKNDGQLRFLFNDPSWNDNDGVAIVDIVVKKPEPATTATIAEPITEPHAKSAITERADKFCEQRLLQHLNGNMGYYNRAIWFLMDPAERRLYLEDALGDNAALLFVVDDKPLAVSGNHVAFPFNGPVPNIGADQEASPEPLDSIVTLPTRGLFAEAQLGHCNACETRDVLRMSDWTQMTVEEPPAITGVQPGPRGQIPSLPQTQLPQSVIQIAQPPTAPDPTGLANALTVLRTPGIFRDMSGLSEASALLGKLADGTIKTLEDMVKTASQAKDKIDTVRAGEAVETATGTAGSAGSSARSGPSATDFADRLSLLPEIKQFASGLGMDAAETKDLAKQVVMGSQDPQRSDGSGSSTSRISPLPPLSPAVGGRSIGPAVLMVGDILVSTTTATSSLAVRLATRAPVSHASLYVGNPDHLVEALEAGVVEQTLTAALADDILSVVFRVPGLTSSEAQLVADYAVSQVGKRYDYWEAFLAAVIQSWPSLGQTLRRVDLNNPDDRFFCSELVIESFSRAGRPLTTIPSDEVLPGAIPALGVVYVGHLKSP